MLHPLAEVARLFSALLRENAFCVIAAPSGQCPCFLHVFCALSDSGCRLRSGLALLGCLIAHPSWLPARKLCSSNLLCLQFQLPSQSPEIFLYLNLACASLMDFLWLNLMLAPWKLVSSVCVPVLTCLVRLACSYWIWIPPLFDLLHSPTSIGKVGPCPGTWLPTWTHKMDFMVPCRPSKSTLSNHRCSKHQRSLSP